MLNTPEVLRLYTREFRTDPIPVPSARIEREGRIIRQVGREKAEHANRILFSNLDPSCANEAIQKQVRFFEGLGNSFEWTVFEHDAPSDLLERLKSAGFEVEPAETVMVMDVEATPLQLPSIAGIDVRKITDAMQLSHITEVQNLVWNEDHTWLQEMLAKELSEDTSRISIYGAYSGQRPVSNAWIRFEGARSFASLNGGSTLPEFRGRGIYKALVDIRAIEAKRRNVRYLTVDASSMSRPILERIGFQRICSATPCIWYCK